MTKTNKELAIDVVIAMINSNPKTTINNNNTISWGLGAKAENVASAIKIISKTLDSIDVEQLSD